MSHAAAAGGQVSTPELLGGNENDPPDAGNSAQPEGAEHADAQSGTESKPQADSKSGRQPGGDPGNRPGRQRQPKPPDAVAPLPKALPALTNDNWSDLCQHLNPGGITGNIMAHCVVQQATDRELRMCLESTQSAVYSDEHRARITQLLAAYFQCPLTLTIEIGDPAAESPAARSQRLKREKLEQIRNQFVDDENVRKLVETFSGEILMDTISPLEHRG